MMIDCTPSTTRPPTKRPITIRAPVHAPSRFGTKKPTQVPSSKPVRSKKPAQVPSVKPSRVPSSKPSRKPSSKPSSHPSGKPIDPCFDYNSFFPGTGHLYHLTDARYRGTYDDALAAAASMPKCCGGTSAHLVTITSVAENNFNVNGFALSLFNDYAYIGLDDRQTSGVHEWVTKEAATTFRQSVVDEVSAGLCVMADESDGWYGTNCGVRYRALFEYLNNTPRPASRHHRRKTIRYLLLLHCFPVVL